MSAIRNTAAALGAAMVLLGAAPSFAADANEKLASLEKRLQRLEDANEVEIVQRTYGYFVDKAMWAEVADLFAESGTYEIGGRGVFVGPKRVLEYLRVGLGTERPVEGRLINHMQFQPIVTVSDDGKTASLRMKALVMSSGGWGDVIYENRYVKEDGIWKIASIRAPFVMYSSNDGWAKVTTPNTRPESFLPPPDRMPTEVYLTYPSQYIVPFHYPHPVTGKPYTGARADQAAERIKAQ
jgi:SnoaL-like protein